MAWIINLVLGAIIGFVYATIFVSPRRTLGLIVGLAMIGSLVGGLFAVLSQTAIFGHLTIYILPAMFSFFLSAGGHYAYTLTSHERRI